MSGFAGVFFRSTDRSVSLPVDRMVASLMHRGRDGHHVWQEDGVVLVQYILDTGSYSGPASDLVHGSSGRFVGVGDIRVDNRPDLISKLGLTGESRRMSDMDLMLLLFERYGSSAPEHVEGDFAVVVYDRQERSVVCVRDHFGTRPLYWYCDEYVLVFASEIKAILASGLVSDAIDVQKVEDFLVGLLADEERTFYQGISRLPPASLLTVTPEDVSTTRYWQLKAKEPSDIPMEELVEGFRSRFIKAVQSRLIDKPSAFMLSGGLDSSSVVCTAASLTSDPSSNINAYSVEFPYLPEGKRKRTDESRYVDAVKQKTSAKVTRLRGDGRTPLDTLAEMLRVHDEPFAVPNAYLDVIAMSAVRDDGLSVLLTGLEGDLTVSHGDGYLSELGFRGDWAKFGSESNDLASRTGNDPAIFFDRYAVPTLERLWQTGRKDVFRRGAKELAETFDRSSRAIAWKYGMRPILARTYHNLSGVETAEKRGALSLIGKTYEGRKRIWERIRESALSSELAETQQEFHLSQLKSGYSTSLLEFSEKNAASMGLDIRHPFFDRDLVSYSVSLPGHAKLYHGWARYVLRASMEQILPDEVRWRAQKAVLGPNFTHLMSNEPFDRLQELVQAAQASFPALLDKTSVNNLLERGKYATLWRVLVLGGWILQKRL